MSFPVRRWPVILVPPATVASILAVTVPSRGPNLWLVIGFWSFAYVFASAGSSTVAPGKAAPALPASSRALLLTYLAAQSVLATLLLTVLRDLETEWAFSLQLVPAAAFVTMFLSVTLSDDAVAGRIEQQEHHRSWHRAAVSEIDRLRLAVDSELARVLEAAAEDLRFSPVEGHPGFDELEAAIDVALTRMSAAVAGGASGPDVEHAVDELRLAIAARNRQLRNLR